MWRSIRPDGDANKNSGVYYRGQWNDEGFVVGYELDVGGWGQEEDEEGNLSEEENWWGELHDPYRRENLWIGPGLEVIKETYKEGEWNHLKIRAKGNHIQHWLMAERWSIGMSKMKKYKKVVLLAFNCMMNLDFK